VRSLVIVRTHRADAASLAAYDRYAALPGLEVVFCVDERAGAADMAGRAKIGFNLATLDAMGLYAHPDYGWRCGDYCYYVVRAARPDYDAYWLVEPDVLVHADDPGEFFGRFALEAADLLAPQLGPADLSWYWTATITRLGMPPFRCIYPLTRLSARAIDHLHELRRCLSADPEAARHDAWPNDEALTASALMQGGFACRDFNHDGRRCYTEESLGFSVLIDEAVVHAKPPDGLIYHPVRPFAPWFDREAARIEAGAAGNESRRSAVMLDRLALTCLRNPPFGPASLIPLMLSAELWARRPWASEANSGEDEGPLRTVRSRLFSLFGVHGHRRRIGSAHVVSWRAGLGPEAGCDDFEAGAGFDIASLPADFALPYAKDAMTGQEILTLHLRPGRVRGNLGAQRGTARVIVRLG
jgi:hypothetical protein